MSAGYQGIQALAIKDTTLQEKEQALEFFESGVICEDECFDTGIVSDDKESDRDSILLEGQDKSVLSNQEQFEILRPTESPKQTPLNTDFDIDHDEQAPNVITDEEDQPPQDTSKEFLRWHHRLGHCPFGKIV